MFRISCSSSLHNGFDEPEILRWSNPKICPGSADVRQWWTTFRGLLHQADYLRTGFEILEGSVFGHNQTLVRPLPCLKQSSSDKAARNPKLRNQIKCPKGADGGKSFDQSLRASSLTLAIGCQKYSSTVRLPDSTSTVAVMPGIKVTGSPPTSRINSPSIATSIM
jgi:hypothetical protein